MDTITIEKQETPATLLFRFLEKILARVEWFRVRNHLRIVERELRSRDTRLCPSELQCERAKNINRLHEYWTAGVYPQNIDFFDKRVPYFKDHVGTPCAMAYLLEQSGHQDLVNVVARENNHVYINDVYDGPVMDWIRASGLTKAEAARVQPTYGPCGSSGICTSPDTFWLMVVWIGGSLMFIILEWLNWRASLWFFNERNKRVFGWLYFGLLSIIPAALITLGFLVWFGPFMDDHFLHFYLDNFETVNVIFAVVVGFIDFVFFLWLNRKASSFVLLGSKGKRVLGWVILTITTLAFVGVSISIARAFVPMVPTGEVRHLVPPPTLPSF